MDVAALSMALAQTNVMQDFSVGMLSKSLDSAEVMSEGLDKLMEQSVTPGLGSIIDYSV